MSKKISDDSTNFGSIVEDFISTPVVCYAWLIVDEHQDEKAKVLEQ